MEYCFYFIGRLLDQKAEKEAGEVMGEKKTFKTLFILLAITLAVLPFVTTFNSFLTALVESSRLYRLVQETILPWEVRMVGVVLQFLKIGVGAGVDTLYLTQGSKRVAVYVAWNCIGWQSLLLFLVSLVVGLQGDFTRFSKINVAAIGFLGIILLNIFRMVVVAVGIFYINDVFALVLHDYFAALLTIIWLIFFWWFSYSYILEEKRRGELNH